MPDHAVDPTETVSRFLFKDDMRPDETTVKPRAFMPPASNLKLSVFRIYSLLETQIWALAAEKVEPVRGIVVVGRGDLSVAQIAENKLRVAPDSDPTSRHADIVEWPENRELRATIAQELAALASPAKKRDSQAV